MTQAELERYRTRLAEQQADAKAYLIARLESEARGGDLDVAGIRKKTIEVMQDCLGVYGDRAQALSAEMFDEICEAEGVDATSKIYDGLIDSDMMEEKVRYYARAIAGEEPDWSGYEGSNADLVSYYVHRSALENMERNCDLNQMRFARVGTGRETCGWCFMLSLRGFVYRSEGTAAASSHVHCDCVIVPGVKGVTKIEGYEPERMRERWRACYQAIGGESQLKEDWDALDAKGRAAYKGRSGSEKYRDFVRKRIQRECETRDNEWLYRGKLPTIDYSDNSRSKYGRILNKSEGFEPYDYRPENIADRGNEWRDLFAHDALRNAGFSIKVFGSDDIDLQIGGSWWEVKSPTGESPRTIENNLRKARKQFDARGIQGTSVVFNDYYLDDALEEDGFIEREMPARMAQHGIRQVLLVKKDGSVVHIKK